MSQWDDERIDAFLADVTEASADAAELDALVAALTPAAAPAPDLRARLLAEATLGGRFDRFAARAAPLLDVDEDRMRATLDRIDDPRAWYASKIPGVSLIDLEGGPKVADAITGFVRMPAGAAFPEHRHLGEEVVLVVQGSFVDSAGAVHRAGEVVRMPAGSAHGFEVRPGPDLVYMVVAQRGIGIGDEVLGPDDPRI